MNEQGDTDTWKPASSTDGKDPVTPARGGVPVLFGGVLSEVRLIYNAAFVSLCSTVIRFCVYICITDVQKVHNYVPMIYNNV